MNTLEILPVKTEPNKNKHKIPSILPQPPFLLTIQAPVRSGKSNLIMNLIYRWYKNLFEDIYFISPTVKNDKTLKILYKDDDIMKIDEDLDQLDSILDEIKDQQDKTPEDLRENILICIDDCLGFLKKGFANLCSRYRHYKISMIVTSQSFRSVPVICRVNSSHYILFKTNNQKELEKIEEEFGGNYKNFLDMYTDATSKRYNFLYLNQESGTCHRNFLFNYKIEE